jgi:hypothetical protein
MRAAIFGGLMLNAVYGKGIGIWALIGLACILTVFMMMDLWEIGEKS